MLRLLKIASGLEIVNCLGLHDPLLPQNPVEKAATFSSGFFCKRGGRLDLNVGGFRPGRTIEQIEVLQQGPA